MATALTPLPQGQTPCRHVAVLTRFLSTLSLLPSFWLPVLFLGHTIIAFCHFWHVQLRICQHLLNGHLKCEAQTDVHLCLMVQCYMVIGSVSCGQVSTCGCHGLTSSHVFRLSPALCGESLSVFARKQSSRTPQPAWTQNVLSLTRFPFEMREWMVLIYFYVPSSDLSLTITL